MRRGGFPQRVYVLIEAAGLAGEPCPTNADLADLLGIEESRVSSIVLHLDAEGLIRVERAGHHRWISAPDGAWRTARSVHRDDRMADLGPRRCLRCRETFLPEHRGRFCCDSCWALNQGVAVG